MWPGGGASGLTQNKCKGHGTCETRFWPIPANSSSISVAILGQHPQQALKMLRTPLTLIVRTLLISIVDGFYRGRNTDWRFLKNQKSGENLNIAILISSKQSRIRAEVWYTPVNSALGSRGRTIKSSGLSLDYPVSYGPARATY